MLKLRLAKKYFDDGRYEEASSIYDELVAKAPGGYEDIPVVGKAQCLEAQGKYADALAAYEAFAAANPKSFLALTAKLGAVRAIALGGDKEKESVKDDELSKARVEAIEDTVRRYQAPVAKDDPAVVQSEAK